MLVSWVAGHGIQAPRLAQRGRKRACGSYLLLVGLVLLGRCIVEGLEHGAVGGLVTHSSIVGRGQGHCIVGGPVVGQEHCIVAAVVEHHTATEVRTLVEKRVAPPRVRRSFVRVVRHRQRVLMPAPTQLPEKFKI